MSGIASTNGFSAVQGVGRPNSVRAPRLPDNATFEQDLLQSGLDADVSTDELLQSVQASIKSAIHDPSNSGKEFFDVIQTAVQKALKENGVDTEKLTSLLQSQIPDQAGLGAYSQDSRPDGLEGASGVGPKGPPPAGVHRPIPPPTDSVASTSAADGVASQFKRLISDLIKSLPSGSTLDIQA
jgi:hypothetical protein